MKLNIGNNMDNHNKYPQRKSPRLQGYDYSSEGAYFVTICTHQKRHIFGHIEQQKMTLNSHGIIASNIWLEIPQHFPSVALDAFVIMPNHVHGIVLLSTTRPHSPKLGTVIGSYKSAVTRLIRKQTPEHLTIWQASYHDHIIRNDKSYHRIRNYVLTNPELWQEDTFYTELDSSD